MKNILKKIKLRTASPTQRAALLKRDGLKIGKGCEVYPGVTFGTEPYLISIGNYVRITADVKFITHDGGVWVLRHLKNEPDLDKFGPIHIGNNVMIGTGAIIMPNTTIGNNCIVGAGAVITRNIPDNSVVVGVPGKIIGNIEDYYKKNKKQLLKTKGLDRKEKRKILLEQYKDI